MLATTAIALVACGSGGGGSDDSETQDAGGPVPEEPSNPPEEPSNPPEEPSDPPEEPSDPPEEPSDPPEEPSDPPEEPSNPPEEPSDPVGGGAYSDDTFAILLSGIDIEVISGPFGYDDFRYSERADGQPLALDARAASFIVANSQNPNPTYDLDCNMGSDPVNPYPVQIYDPDKTAFVGGIINGEIPQESDWKPTYCNSAAIIFKDAPDSIVDGVRITSAWDGIRAGPNSPDLIIKNSWLSNVRDDAVENDDFLPLVFEDNLVDGAFQGISIHSGGDIDTQSPERIELYGNVIRIREYLYKGGQRYGSLFKDENSSPRSVIYDTVLAVDYKGGNTWGGSWERTWSKIEDCDNNLFLWLSDKSIDVPLPPACFRVLKGAEARAEWARAKQNWINCHPRVARKSGDPASNPEQCVANDFGGYSR